MLNSLISLMPTSRVNQERLFTPNSALHVLPAREMYNLLEAYYQSNGLYDGFTASMQRAGLWSESMKELRNPANRVCEFYAAKLWAGDLPKALPVSSKNPELADTIYKVWGWSNWASEKQLAARWFAMMGDLFIKVAEKETELAPVASSGQIAESVTEYIPGTPPDQVNRKVFLQVLDPRHVTDFTTDERGFLIYCRIDVPQTERVQAPRGGGVVFRNFMHTEIWEKRRLQVWQHTGSPETPQERMGEPIIDRANELGFVPIAYTPFRKISRDRGQGAFTHALSKIDEVNRITTRLHGLLFRHNNVTWALRANATDPNGRPLPPPAIGPAGREAMDDTSSVTLGGENMIALPGNSELVPIIPRLDYGSMLQILNASIDDMRDDLPELRYFETAFKRGVSGVAMRYMLSDASDRVIEARGNAEACLVRADQMALTIGQRALIPGFEPEKIGTFDNGDFDHSFLARDIFPVSPSERAQAVQQLVSAKLPVNWVLRQVGFSEDEIADLERERQKEVDYGMAQQKKQADLALEQQKLQGDQALAQQATQAQSAADLAKAQAEHAAGLDIQTHAAKTAITAAAATGNPLPPA